jgi:hypothetical protein
LSFPFRLNVLAELHQIEGPAPTEFDRTGYLSGRGHFLDLTTTQPKDVFSFFNPDTFDFHHATL